MKILLMCGAGASSGFMAQAMRKAAKAQNMEEGRAGCDNNAGYPFG